jgi:hypothetical protein
MTSIHQICTNRSRVARRKLSLGETDVNRKTVLYFATAFLLFAVDVGCTYTTFAVRGVPIEFEVNQVFRDWVIRDGWLLSIGKFTILKTLLFALAGWAIFRTQSRIAAFVLAQCMSAITWLPSRLTRLCGGWTTWSIAHCY